MRIVVGLGNPGRAYDGSRHNVGFEVIEELAGRWRFRLGPTRNGVRMAHGLVAGEMTVLIEPQMYMNLSGMALARGANDIAPRDLIVIHDDIDLGTGRVRVKRGGGTGGHHGLDSIADQYGSDFTRVRVGIGRPPRGADIAEYVLSAFEPSEREMIRVAIQCAADAVECVLGEGEEAAMNRYNVRTTNRPATVAADTGRK